MHFLQRTIRKPVQFSGVGLHSGKTVNVKIRPAPVNHGIKFKRIDLPGSPCIPALFKMVVDTTLATVIGYDGCIVSTIEHLMASFAGLSIDNALVELDAYEVPVMDGSAGPFIELIKQAGITDLGGPRSFFIIKKPIEISQNGKSVGIYPHSTFKITFTIEFDNPVIGKQTYAFETSDKTFECEICKARTFGFRDEVEYHKSVGLAQGGSLDNAVVIDGHAVMNPDGLRFPDEFVRHKILDCIGDFSLLGMPILGHIVANKSSHAFHHAFLQTFFSHKESWETRTINDICDLIPFLPKPQGDRYRWNSFVMGSKDPHKNNFTF